MTKHDGLRRRRRRLHLANGSNWTPALRLSIFCNRNVLL